MSFQRKNVYINLGVLTIRSPTSRDVFAGVYMEYMTGDEQACNAAENFTPANLVVINQSLKTKFPS